MSIIHSAECNVSTLLSASLVRLRVSCSPLSLRLARLEAGRKWGGGEVTAGVIGAVL
jgi:hypothetical protein